jgi:hypothetical protein
VKGTAAGEVKPNMLSSRLQLIILILGLRHRIDSYIDKTAALCCSKDMTVLDGVYLLMNFVKLVQSINDSKENK